MTDFNKNNVLLEDIKTISNSGKKMTVDLIIPFLQSEELSKVLVSELQKLIKHLEISNVDYATNILKVLDYYESEFETFSYNKLELLSYDECKELVKMFVGKYNYFLYKICKSISINHNIDNIILKIMNDNSNDIKLLNLIFNYYKQVIVLFNKYYPGSFQIRNITLVLSLIQNYRIDITPYLDEISWSYIIYPMITSAIKQKLIKLVPKLYHFSRKLDLKNSQRIKDILGFDTSMYVLSSLYTVSEYKDIYLKVLKLIKDDQGYLDKLMKGYIAKLRSLHQDNSKIISIIIQQLVPICKRSNMILSNNGKTEILKMCPFIKENEELSEVFCR